MANELQPLSLLFQNRLFRIPDYQRGYAWLQQQLVDFWDDLVNLPTDRYHYTGLLSLKPLKSKETVSWGEDLWLVENGYKPCHIVDGQQRITTFVILLNEIVGFVLRVKLFVQFSSGFGMENALPDENAPEPEPPRGKIIPFERVG